MTDWTGRKTSYDGVSESIGFLLIFGMVIVGIGLVTLYGYPLLLQQQTSADKQIMEKNMIVLQNDMKSLAYKTVPYKETMLNIGGGTLTVHNTSYVPHVSSMTIYNTGTGQDYELLFHPGDLQYYSLNANTEITLENGAVVMRNLVEPGSVMLAQPRWFYDSQTNTMVINLISLNSSYAIARSGVGTVQMSMGMTNYSVMQGITSPVCVKYMPDATMDYSTAWKNYFTTVMGMSQGNCAADEFQLPPALSSGGTLVIKKYDIVITSV
jgi:hypothetical protein